MFEEFKGTGIPIPTPKKPSGDFLKKLPKIVLIAVIALVLLAVVASSWYTVNDKEQGCDHVRQGDGHYGCRLPL